MTGWDILSGVMSSFPPVAATAVLVAAAVVFIVGFGRHGHAFLKYGFKQVAVVSSLERRFDSLENKLSGEIEGLRMEVKSEIEGLRSEIDGVKTEVATIKTNHFGHLKSYLGVLNGVLLDRQIIDNETRARLDNEIRGM